MRLLNVESFLLESHNDEKNRPPYLILSHRWGENEILFEDLLDNPQEKEIQMLQYQLQHLQKSFEERERCTCTENVTSGETLGDTQQERDKPSRYGVEKEIDDNLQSLGLLPRLRHAKQKDRSWDKIYGCCREAKSLGFSYVWIDTCCINKESSSELSESINSMFSWYRSATLCIAYLDDVFSEAGGFEKSVWFKRGWTLQELIAPDEVYFYDRDWRFLGLRSTLASKIASITTISETVLRHKSQLCIQDFTIAAKLSWAAGRVCTKAEDRSYSLLGLLGVNMPIIYGEGERASFFRLQSEIFKSITDYTIFAWKIDSLSRHSTVNMFAPHVDCFQHASSIVFRDRYLQGIQLSHQTVPGHSKASHGVRVCLTIRQYKGQFQAYLGCGFQGSDSVITIFLKEDAEGNFLRFGGAICEVECITLKESEWLIQEFFVSHPKSSLSAGAFRLMTLEPDQELEMMDHQVINSGFTRITSLSAFSADTDVESLYAAANENWCFNTAVKFQIISSTRIIPRRSDSADWSGTFVYLNKDTMTLFCMCISLVNRVRLRIAIIEPTDLDLSWDFVGTRVITRNLTNKWHLLVHSSIGNIQQLHLTAKLITPLEID